MEKPIDHILLEPVMTEKALRLAEEEGIYTFYVHPKAEKIEIKRAVERLFHVKVEWVHTIKLPPKPRRAWLLRRWKQGKKTRPKKALIKLREGYKIPKLFEIG